MKTLDEVNNALIKVIGRRDAKIQIQSEEIIRLERESKWNLEQCVSLNKELEQVKNINERLLSQISDYVQTRGKAIYECEALQQENEGLKEVLRITSIGTQAEIDQAEGRYLSAVKGRQDFRRLYREEREKNIRLQKENDRLEDIYNEMQKSYSDKDDSVS